MRKIPVALVLLCILVPAHGAFAQYSCSGGVGPFFPGYYDYTHNPLINSDQTCWAFNATISATTLKYCYGSPAGWQFNTWYGQSATHSFVVANTDPGGSNWSIQVEVDFEDPTSSWYNQIVMDVVVTHNGANTTYNVYTAVGSAGSTSYCGLHSTNFTAVAGDTVTVRVTGARVSASAIVKFKDIHIWRWS